MVTSKSYVIIYFQGLRISSSRISSLQQIEELSFCLMVKLTVQAVKFAACVVFHYLNCWFNNRLKVGLRASK